MTTNATPKDEPYEVVMIGAGPSGIVAAKTLLAHKVSHILVLEECDATGGLWHRQARPRVPCWVHYKAANGEMTQLEIETSSLPVYADMRANTPKDWTSFLGHAFPAKAELFPDAQTVAFYYQEYSQRFGVDHVTRLNTRVDRCVKKGDDDSCWKIDAVNNQTGEQIQVTSRRLLVCNGHYRKAYCPCIPGLEHFKGRLLHSSAFSSTKEFADQTVLIVGGGISGGDIAKQLWRCGKCSRIVVSVRQWTLYQDLLLTRLQRQGVVVRPGIAGIRPDGEITFLPPPTQADCNKSKYSPADEESLHPDVILFATGYRYNFPFLDEHMASSSNKERTSGLRVMREDGFKMERLYKRILSIDDPSLAFVGITNQNFTPVIMMEYQARWYTQKVVKDGCRTLDPQIMAQEVASRANDPTQDALLLQFPSYCNSLARDIGIRGFWMQVLCDRLPLMFQTWWTRRTPKPWWLLAGIGGGLASVLLSCIGGVKRRFF